VRDEGPNAGLVLRLSELVFHFATLFVDHKQRLNRHSSEGLTTLRYPVAQGEIVAAVQYCREQYNCTEHSEK
jgi:hypothetical protein